MSSSTLDQYAPREPKVVQETTPHPYFASYRIKVSHAACNDEFDEILDLTADVFFYFRIIAIEKPYTTARILENE